MVRASDIRHARWRTSTRCDANSCVEVAVLAEIVAIRNSADPDGPVLMFSRDAWRGLLSCIREGEFGVSPASG